MLAERIGKPENRVTVKSHWRPDTVQKPEEDMKTWRNRQPRLPTIEYHDLYCRTLSKAYRMTQEQRLARAARAQIRTLSDSSEDAILEQQLAHDELNLGYSLDYEFYSALARLENAWSDQAGAKSFDKIGLSCERDHLKFCNVHSSPFERRSETCAKALLKREPTTTSSTDLELESQFLSSLKECAVGGMRVPWPDFVRRLKSLGLDRSDKRENEMEASLDVLIDFSGFCGEHGGFLLSLRRLGLKRDQSGKGAFRQSLAKDGRLKGGGLRTRDEKYGTNPSLGVGDHLVIRYHEKIRLAVRLQRAPSANEAWRLYPEQFPWRSTKEQAKDAEYPWEPPEDRVVLMPRTYQTDDADIKTQQEEIERIRTSDSSLQILFEEIVSSKDSNIKVLFIADPAMDVKEIPCILCDFFAEFEPPHCPACLDKRKVLCAGQY